MLLYKYTSSDWHRCLYNYLSHGFQEVTLRITRHEVILHGFQEVTSEYQVIPFDRAVTSMVSMIQKNEMARNK